MEITRHENGTVGRLVLKLTATVLYRSSWQYEAWHCCVKWWHLGTVTQIFLQQMACHNLSVHHNNGQQLVSPQLTKFTRTTLWYKMTVAFSSLLMALLHISLLGEKRMFPHYGCFLVSGVMLGTMFHNAPPPIHWRNCSPYYRCNI